MLSIGEFSRVTRLTIKALRLYHEKGILVPDLVDGSSSYRYYGPRAVEKAGVVARLKEMGFSLDEIKAILEECRDDREIIARVERKLADIDRDLRRYQAMKDNLDLFLQSTEGQAMKFSPEIGVEAVSDRLICGIRFKGRYEGVGPKFGELFRKCGRKARGRPFSLFYDGEFREEDADIEVAVEVRERVAAEGLDCRVLAGGTAVVLLHRGPYEKIGGSYQKLYEHSQEKSLHPLLPTRELYLKGPGMILRGNPKKYLTRLQVFFES